MSDFAIVPTDEGTVELEARKNGVHLRLVFDVIGVSAFIDDTTQPMGAAFSSGMLVHDNDEMLLAVMTALRRMAALRLADTREGPDNE